MNEKMLAKKSKKTEMVYAIIMAVLLVVHLAIFGVIFYNIFSSNGNKQLGLNMGLFAGIPTLVLFICVYAVYALNRSAPDELIEEGEDSFILLGGKEYCRYEYVDEISAKPFMGFKKEDTFGSISMVLTTGDTFKIKSVDNVFEIEKRMKEIVEEKKNNK